VHSINGMVCHVYFKIMCAFGKPSCDWELHVTFMKMKHGLYLLQHVCTFKLYRL
jgi:hypothetical protein